MVEGAEENTNNETIDLVNSETNSVQGCSSAIEEHCEESACMIILSKLAGKEKSWHFLEGRSFLW